MSEKRFVALQGERIIPVEYDKKLDLIAFTIVDEMNHRFKNKWVTIWIPPTASFLDIDDELDYRFTADREEWLMERLDFLYHGLMECPTGEYWYFDRYLTERDHRAIDEQSMDHVKSKHIYVCYEKDISYSKTGIFYQVPAEKYYKNEDSIYFDTLFSAHLIEDPKFKDVLKMRDTPCYADDTYQLIGSMIEERRWFDTQFIAGEVVREFVLDDKKILEVAIDENGTKIYLNEDLCEDTSEIAIEDFYERIKRN